MEMTQRVAITRARGDAAEFLRLAAEAGIEPLPLPTIRLVEKGDDIAGEFIKRAAEFDPDHTVFMSSKAATLLCDSASKTGRRLQLADALAKTQVMAVGPKTRESLERHGVRVAHMPDTYSSVGVGELFTGLTPAGKRAIVPRSGASTPFLAELLAKIGMEVSEVHLYDVRPAAIVPEWDRFAEMLKRGAVDGVVFTSASSVRAFFDIMKGFQDMEETLAMLGRTIVVAIGPFTALELEKFAVKMSTAQVHTVPGALEAMVELLGRPKKD